MKKGFTLIELLIVLGVIAILLGVIIPSFRGMQEEGYRARAQKECESLQVATESFYKNYGSYPGGNISNLSIQLSTTTPKILVEIPSDPFNTAGFSYLAGTDATFGNWYMIGSPGPDRTFSSSYRAAVGGWDVIGDDIIVSNAPKYNR